MINREEILAQAKKELKEDAVRQAVDKMKEKLKKQRWYHKLMPYKIVLIKRG